MLYLTCMSIWIPYILAKHFQVTVMLARKMARYAMGELESKGYNWSKGGWYRQVSVLCSYSYTWLTYCVHVSTLYMTGTRYQCNANNLVTQQVALLKTVGDMDAIMHTRLCGFNATPWSTWITVSGNHIELKVSAAIYHTINLTFQRYLATLRMTINKFILIIFLQHCIFATSVQRTFKACRTLWINKWLYWMAIWLTTLGKVNSKQAHQHCLTRLPLVVGHDDIDYTSIQLLNRLRRRQYAWIVLHSHQQDCASWHHVPWAQPWSLAWWHA